MRSVRVCAMGYLKLVQTAAGVSWQAAARERNEP
jgi:hypothetical protein